MKNDKTKEWYFTFWDMIKGDLLNCVREIESKGELSEMQKRGVKIYKKGDRNLIKTIDQSHFLIWISKL